MILGLKAMFFLFVAGGLLLFGGERDDDDEYTVIPPTLKTEINSSSDWKAYTGHIYSFSYPPGWKVEECVENCADTASLKVSKDNGNSYLQISNQTYDKLPVSQCIIEVNKRTYFWNSENIEFLHTKDEHIFQIVEGDYRNDSSTGPKSSYRLFGDIIDGNTCHQIFGGELKKSGEVKKIVQTLSIATKNVRKTVSPL